MNADKTLTQTITLTLNVTLFLTLFTSCMVRIFTNESLLKRLVREYATSNLNSRYFVDSRVSVKRVIYSSKYRPIARLCLTVQSNCSQLITGKYQR